jgi:hypothetical protein
MGVSDFLYVLMIALFFLIPLQNGHSLGTQLLLIGILLFHRPLDQKTGQAYKSRLLYGSRRLPTMIQFSVKC